MEKKRTWYLKFLIGSAGFVFLFLVWWLISYLMHLSGNRLLPYPSDTLVAMFGFLFGSGARITYIAMGWTILRILIGFVVSFLLGAIFGTLAGIFKHFGDFMSPFVLFSKSVPTAAIVVILVGVFYQFRGLPPYIPCFLVFLVAFPLIYEAFRKGLSSETQEVKDALRLDCGDRSWRAIFLVELPDSWNYIALALAQSLGLSVKVSVMSEILVNSSSAEGGLGAMIQMAWQIDGDMKSVIAYSLIAVVLSTLMDIPLAFLKHQVEKRIG